MLLDQRHQLGAKAAGARGFMHHDTTAGLLHGIHNRLQVQRPDGPQVNDFGVHTALGSSRFGHVHHGAVGDHGQSLARAEDGGSVQRHGVVALGHIAHGVFGPGHNRLVVVAVKRAVVQTLGLQKDDGVVVLDGRDQQTLGVIRVGRHHRAQAADLGEHGLRALAVGLPAVDAAAARHAYRHGAGEITGRAVTQARRLGHDLVGGRVDVIRKLDFDDRPQTVSAHAHRGANNAALGDGGIEHA